MSDTYALMLVSGEVIESNLTEDTATERQSYWEGRLIDTYIIEE